MSHATAAPTAARTTCGCSAPSATSETIAEQPEAPERQAQHQVGDGAGAGGQEQGGGSQGQRQPDHRRVQVGPAPGHRLALHHTSDALGEPTGLAEEAANEPANAHATTSQSTANRTLVSSNPTSITDRGGGRVGCVRGKLIPITSFTTIPFPDLAPRHTPRQAPPPEAGVPSPVRSTPEALR